MTPEGYAVAFATGAALRALDEDTVLERDDYWTTEGSA